MLLFIHKLFQPEVENQGEKSITLEENDDL